MNYDWLRILPELINQWSTAFLFQPMRARKSHISINESTDLVLRNQSGLAVWKDRALYGDILQKCFNIDERLIQFWLYLYPTLLFPETPFKAMEYVIFKKRRRGKFTPPPPPTIGL